MQKNDQNQNKYSLKMGEKINPKSHIHISNSTLKFSSSYALVMLHMLDQYISIQNNVNGPLNSSFVQGQFFEVTE